MEKIIVGFSKPKKWKPFAWIIMKFYDIPYDHVYIKFWSSKFQRNVIYQASQLMVNFMGEKFFESENDVIKEFELDITDEDRTSMIQFAMDEAGKPYGMLNALGLAIVGIFDRLGKKIKNPLGDGEKTYICCELVADILDRYTSVKNIDSDTVNPKELYNILLNLQQ